MKSLLLIGLTTLSAIAADPPGWKLVWSDEFDRPGKPNSSKWGYEEGLVRNQEKQFYTNARKENARVEDGKLVIEAHKKAKGGGDFTSASLHTKNLASWQFGRFEVRAKLPSTRGTWPAIWMLPEESGIPWPLTGEIDIMEHVGFEPGKIHGTLHSGAYNHKLGNQRNGTIMVPTYASDFHVYAMEWSDDKIVMYLDGKAYVTFNRQPGDQLEQWSFSKKFYLILNLAIGGMWGGMKGIDDAAFPQRMEVDYVRVYELTNNKPSKKPTALGI